MEAQLAQRQAEAMKDISVFPCQTNYQIPSAKIKDAF